MNWRVRFWTLSPSVQGTVRLPRFVYTASGYPPDLLPRNVQRLTAGVQKCHLRQSTSHGLVNWRVRFWNRSLSVQGTARPHILVYTDSITCTCEGTGNVQSRTAGVHRCH